MARTARRLATALLAALLLIPAAPAAAASKPGDGILLLESYATKPSEVLLGQEFELRLELRNAGSKKAEDLLVTLGTGSGVASADATAAGEGMGGGGSSSSLVVVGGGNTKHLERIGAKATESVSFKLLSDPSGSPGLVALPVTIEYSVGGRRTLSQTVGIVLRRPTRLRLVSMTAPDSVMTGEQFEVVAEVTNAGDAKVSAVSLRLDGENSAIEGGEVFLGNLEPGDGDVLEAQVTIAEAGKTALTLTIEYLDEFGETRETTETLEVDASESASEAVEPAADDGAEGGFFAAIAGFFKALFGLGE